MLVFEDGSSKHVRGWHHAGFAGFYGRVDERNFTEPVPKGEL